MASHRILDDFSEDLTADDLAIDDRNYRRSRRSSPSRASAPKRPNRRPPRTEADQAFRCRKCRQFIGAPLTGGRHRNHCPNCLHSLHLDLKRPGDRRSDCESLMRPRGLIERRNGEQMILHECLGCGKTQPTRVAADDNPILLMRLRPIGLPEHIDTVEFSVIEETA
ncbi:MAG TPA: RNHCP domain-containing protein [Thermomicrobiales bacterium]|nr:RNHCP domain-containing protein [Thermomicrobiales bacterium]